tara:strand:- start:144 stop:266 length:123 start_codon:yes stop_codon:yes gene_type:complete
MLQARRKELRLGKVLGHGQKINTNVEVLKNIEDKVKRDDV